jgi:hypothetical protein
MILSHAQTAESLIVLCCNGIYRGHDYREPFAERNWVLLPYQAGDPPFYAKQIAEAVRLTAAHPQSLMVISGGQTRPEGGQRSESGSYLQVLSSLGHLGQPGARQRCTIEEYATDSYQNILFSICRFREVVGRFPARVCVVGWGFKAARADFHRQTLRWPADRFVYAGCCEPDDIATARANEGTVLAQYRDDPYGTGPVLGPKRDGRNPFRRTAPYAVSCPEVAGLLAHQGPAPYPHALPWEAGR